MRHGEKLSESLINETQSLRKALHKDLRKNYYHIIPSYKSCEIDECWEYNSKSNLMNNNDLFTYLTRLKLL